MRQSLAKRLGDRGRQRIGDGRCAATHYADHSRARSSTARRALAPGGYRQVQTVLYRRSGTMSAIAARALTRPGYTNVSDLQGVMEPERPRATS